MQAPAACSVAALQIRARGVFPPTIVDVRGRDAFERDPVRIPLALRLLPEAVDEIDRIACPWLIRRFVDASAEILYVPNASVRTVAREENAIPFDVPDVEYTHAGERCSFDAFVARHAPDDDALVALADIVRAADTDTLERSPQAAGLLAVSLGLGAGLADDAALLHHGLLVYDALYAWSRDARGERHGWNAATLRV